MMQSTFDHYLCVSIQHAPTDLAREIQQKKNELRRLVSKAMRNKVEVYDVLGKADWNCETLGNHDTLTLALQYHSRREVVPKSHATLRYVQYQRIKQDACRYKITWSILP